MEEALKMRNLLQEFLKKHDGLRYPSILGVREHIFTGRWVNVPLLLYKTVIIVHTSFDMCISDTVIRSVSSLAWFMSNQETSFVTIGQRIFANPLRYCYKNNNFDWISSRSIIP